MLKNLFGAFGPPMQAKTRLPLRISKKKKMSKKQLKNGPEWPKTKNGSYRGTKSDSQGT